MSDVDETKLDELTQLSLKMIRELIKKYPELESHELAEQPFENNNEAEQPFENNNEADSPSKKALKSLEQSLSA